MRLENGKVDEDIARLIVIDQEAETARDVEPFDDATMARFAVRQRPDVTLFQWL
jgi:hypothetical protein